MTLKLSATVLFTFAFYAASVFGISCNIESNGTCSVSADIYDVCITYQEMCQWDRIDADCSTTRNFDGYYVGKSGGTSNSTLGVFLYEKPLFANATACYSDSCNPCPVADRGVDARPRGCQWAAVLLNFSSQYDDPEWAASQVLGAPNVYPQYDDIDLAWTPAAEFYDTNSIQYVELQYPNAIDIGAVHVVETSGAGHTVAIKTRASTGDRWVTIWSGKVDDSVPAEARWFAPRIKYAGFPTRQLRVEINMSSPQWVEIDAVEICPFGSSTPTTTSSTSSGAISSATSNWAVVAFAAFMMHLIV